MSDSDPRANGTMGPSRRRFLAATAGATAVGLGTGMASASGCEEAASGDGMDTDESDPFAAIEFTNQSSGGSEIVADATLVSDGGYVAIHDASLLQGEVVASVIGVSEYLGRGAHYGVPITLFDVPGADFDQSALESTQPLIAMPHRETSGNQSYDFVSSEGEQDGPYVEAGLPVIDAGFVTVDGDDDPAADAPFATIDARNQSIAEGMATIRDVALSEGGFVTLHDARLLQGAPFESVVGVSEYLEAGQHQAVEVPIEDPSGVTEVELPARPLVPMPHRDTNGNETYDFVDTEGAEDGPYTKAGQAVIDACLVTVGE